MIACGVKFILRNMDWNLYFLWYGLNILVEDQLSQTRKDRIAIMQKDALNNVRITDEQVLMTPEQLKAAFPLSLAQKRR